MKGHYVPSQGLIMIKHEKSVWANNSSGRLFTTTKVQSVRGHIRAYDIETDLTILLPIYEFLDKFTWKYNETIDEENY